MERSNNQPLKKQRMIKKKERSSDEDDDYDDDDTSEVSSPDKSKLYSSLPHSFLEGIIHYYSIIITSNIVTNIPITIANT